MELIAQIILSPHTWHEREGILRSAPFQKTKPESPLQRDGSGLSTGSMIKRYCGMVPPNVNCKPGSSESDLFLLLPPSILPISSQDSTSVPLDSNSSKERFLASSRSSAWSFFFLLKIENIRTTRQLDAKVRRFEKKSRLGDNLY